MAVARKKETKSETLESKILDELIQHLNKSSVEVKYARGHFMGGLVIYRGQRYLYLNRAANAKSKINVILNEWPFAHLSWDELSETAKAYIEREMPEVFQKKTDIREGIGVK